MRCERVRVRVCTRAWCACAYPPAAASELPCPTYRHLSFLVPSCYRVQPGDLQRGLCTSWQASFSSDLFSLEMT